MMVLLLTLTTTPKKEGEGMVCCVSVPGSRVVHLVDECDAGHTAAPGLPPHSQRLGLQSVPHLTCRSKVNMAHLHCRASDLHTCRAIQQGNGSVQHSQRALHLKGEVCMAGSVHQVERAASPAQGDGCRGDGDPPLPLWGQVVHHSAAAVHVCGGGTGSVALTSSTCCSEQLTANSGGEACAVQHALCGGGLAGVDVSHDADVVGQPRAGGDTLSVERENKAWSHSLRSASLLSRPAPT